MSALRADHHVHSLLSADATGSLSENLAAARARGLTLVCCVEHVTAATTWVPVFTRSARLAARLHPVDIFCGVEATILDTSGTLDLPKDLAGVDRVLISDDAYPGESGPSTPDVVAQELARGRLSGAEIVETLVSATIEALRRAPLPPQLAHPLSLLPRVGLSEEAVGDDHLRALAGAARAAGAVVECNERWRCPGPRALAAFRAAGVPVVAATSSHRSSDVGRYEWVAAALGVDSLE